MLVVHGFGTLPPLASPSPFCLKLETWLRLAGVPYRAKGDFNPFTAPKGKAPWVTLEDGTAVSDSAHIIRLLSGRPGVTLDQGLTDEERSRAILLERLCENHLYHAIVFLRWACDDGFAIVRREYFRALSAPAVWFVPTMARRSAVRALWAEGTGRHSRAEVEAGAIDDLRALALALGDAPYFLGDLPRGVDATTWSFLASIHEGPFPGALQDALRAHPNLVAYVARVRGLAWAS